MNSNYVLLILKKKVAQFESPFKLYSDITDIFSHGNKFQVTTTKMVTFDWFIFKY